MREKNLDDVIVPRNNRNRVQVILTSTSRIARPEDEMIVLMKTARNRFKKMVASGKLEIISKREWTLW